MALKHRGCQDGDVVNCSGRGPGVHCVKMVMKFKKVYKNGSFLPYSTYCTTLPNALQYLLP
jgi:hypothetical protein